MGEDHFAPSHWKALPWSSLATQNDDETQETDQMLDFGSMRFDMVHVLPSHVYATTYPAAAQKVDELHEMASKLSAFGGRTASDQVEPSYVTTELLPATSQKDAETQDTPRRSAWTCGISVAADQSLPSNTEYRVCPVTIMQVWSEAQDTSYV